jgi:hypothetical protein
MRRRIDRKTEARLAARNREGGLTGANGASGSVNPRMRQMQDTSLGVCRGHAEAVNPSNELVTIADCPGRATSKR